VPAFVAAPNEFAPKQGPPGQNVTLNGRNLNLGTVSVAFGSVAATIVGTPTPTSITAAVPGGLAPGAVRITVTTTGGSAVTQGTFNVLAPPPPPVFAAPGGQFAPKTGPVGQAVTLNGAGFSQPGLQVMLSGVACPLNGAVTDSTIPIKIPAVALGPGQQFTVTTAGGSATSTDGFTVV